MRVRVDMTRCQGHGQCVLTCPEIFSADEQGFPVVKDSEVSSALAAKVERAVLRCPERAIQLER